MPRKISDYRPADIKQAEKAVDYLRECGEPAMSAAVWGVINGTLAEIQHDRHHIADLIEQQGDYGGDPSNNLYNQCDLDNILQSIADEVRLNVPRPVEDRLMKQDEADGKYREYAMEAAECIIEKCKKGVHRNFNHDDAIRLRKMITREIKRQREAGYAAGRKDALNHAARHTRQIKSFAKLDEESKISLEDMAKAFENMAEHREGADDQSG